MTEKAYSCDVIEITKEIVGRAKIGEVHTVDMRQSDMGACDDNVLMTETELIVYDDEYKIIKKVNPIHDKRKLKEFLNRSDVELLIEFKKESTGEAEFNHFMQLIRKLNRL